MTLPLHHLKRRPVDTLAALKSDSAGASRDAAGKLIAEAKEYGLDLRDFLTLAIDVRGSADAAKYHDSEGLLTGYEASLAYLGLPVRQDLENGIVLDLASDTFQTYAGTRALFPEVIDDIVRWKYRQDQFETTEAIVGQSRTVPGIEMISTVVDDAAADYQGISAVSELGRVRIKTIRTTENSVKFYKHGGGYQTSYEFSRRARLDMLTPYVNRMNRERAMSKVWAATNILINGDGVHSAAGSVNQSTYNTVAGVTATNTKINYKCLLAWLVARAKAGTPVDTVIGDWDAYIQWLFMFAIPTSDKVRTDAEDMAASGFRIGGVPLINGVVNFAVSSACPQYKLIGLSKGDTLEELIESGSLIEESERSIQNQAITYVKTENAGYRLAFGDTRSIYDFNA